MDKWLVVQRETHIAAPCAAVFAFLTDPEKIIAGWAARRPRTRIRAVSTFSKASAGAAPAAPARGRAGSSPRLQLRLGGH